MQLRSTKKKEHRIRIQRTCDFLDPIYPEYADTEGEVVNITQEQMEDPDFFAHTRMRDLQPIGINPQSIKA